ncbi:MAG: regulatory iron-sulfur-containing complex subunit RicT [Candidatus Berkelbacteria bacterium]
MSEIFVKTRSDGKIYPVDKGNLEVVAGDQVLFDSDQCQEIARVMLSSEAKKETDSLVPASQTTGVIVRRLNERDLEIDEKRKVEARENLDRCKQIVAKHDLPMELLDADISYDGKKLTFYFSAPGRVDFRSLVSELAANFQKLIRLQQVGARDRARFVGGVGRCGQGFCCKRFLKGELDVVSIDMAYDQNLAQMGSNRVTGACGKLMCCLKYELDFYKKQKKALPAVGSKIKTAKGMGTVVHQCIVKNIVKVELEDRTILEVDCP